MDILFFHAVTYPIKLVYYGYFIEMDRVIFVSIDVQKVEDYWDFSDNPSYLPGNPALSGV